LTPDRSLTERTPTVSRAGNNRICTDGHSPAQIRHVIIHELCHLQEHNHSAAFYALMDAAQPDWRTHKAALIAYQRKYRL